MVKRIRGGVLLRESHDGGPLVIQILMSPFTAESLNRQLLSEAVTEVLNTPEMRWSKATAVRAFFRHALLKPSRYKKKHDRQRLAAHLQESLPAGCWLVRPVCSTVPPRVWQKYLQKRSMLPRAPLPVVNTDGLKVSRGGKSGSLLLYCGQGMASDDMMEDDDDYRWCYVCGCGGNTHQKLCGPHKGDQCISCLRAQWTHPSDDPDPQDVLRIIPLKDDRVLPEELVTNLLSTGLWSQLNIRAGAVPAGDSAGSSLVLCGGFDFSEEVPLAQCEAIEVSKLLSGDPVVQAWPSLQRPRACAGLATASAEAVMAVGGGSSMFTAAEAFCSVEVFRFGAGQWRPGPALQKPRCAAGVCVTASSQAFAVSGYAGHDLYEDGRCGGGMPWCIQNPWSGSTWAVLRPCCAAGTRARAWRRRAPGARHASGRMDASGSWAVAPTSPPAWRRGRDLVGVGSRGSGLDKALTWLGFVHAKLRRLRPCTVDTVERLDPREGRWQEAPLMPGRRRCFAASFGIDRREHPGAGTLEEGGFRKDQGKLYIYGGWNRERWHEDSAARLDLRNLCWETLPSPLGEAESIIPYHFVSGCTALADDGTGSGDGSGELWTQWTCHMESFKGSELRRWLWPLQFFVGVGVEFSLILDQDLFVRTDEALRRLTEALERSAGSVQVQNSVGVTFMYLAKSRSGALKERLQEAAVKAFGKAKQLAQRATSRRGKGSRPVLDSDVEVAAANAALAERHLAASRWNAQGIELDRQHRWEEAADVFRRAMQVLPEFDARTANNLGTVIYKNATYRSSGWDQAMPLYQAAQELFERALKKLPGPAHRTRLRDQPSRGVAMRNWMDMLEEAVGTPTPETPDVAIPSSVKPFDAALMTEELRAFVLEEKLRSDPSGAPGWAFAMTASYDLNRADGKKFGRISKAMFAFTNTFELYQEDDPEGGPLLKAEGSFSEKNYVIKSRQGKVVATCTRLKGFTGGNVDNYQVIVAKDVDASLVLAMAVVIDEIHDEENPNTEGGEALPETCAIIQLWGKSQLTAGDAKGLPQPKAPSNPIPSDRAPLDAELMHATNTAYELEEKGLSMTGEDFEIKNPLGQVLLRISGGNRLPIGNMPAESRTTAPVRGRKEGSFSERSFEFKSRDGATVATVGRGYYQTDNENRYHVVVGPQVDATLVVAMAFAIDEVHDEENAAEAKKEEEQMVHLGYPGAT
eukprot:g17561.t1